MKMMYIVVLLYVFLAMYARKVPFLPQPPVDDTALTAVYGISSEKLLKYYINIVLYSR